MLINCHFEGMPITLKGDGFAYVDGLPSQRSPKRCAMKRISRALYEAFVGGSEPDDAGLSDISVRFNGHSEYALNDGVWVGPDGKGMPESYIEPVKRFLKNQANSIAKRYIKTNTKKVQVEPDTTPQTELATTY